MKPDTKPEAYEVIVQLRRRLGEKREYTFGSDTRRIRVASSGVNKISAKNLPTHQL